MSVLITIPVYNEEDVLEKTVKRVFSEAEKNLGDFKILIADNASTDDTLKIAKKLSRNKKIDYLHLNKKGRGRALKYAWSRATEDIVCYMDVDLSTDIKHLKELIGSIQNGYDISIGSRLLKNSEVENRKFLRELFSRGYNFLIKTLFFTSFHDAQCGFKAIKRDVFMDLLPKIKDNIWFFDSEFLIIAEKSGYTIKEVPVKWTDDPSTTVKVLGTAWDDIKGLIRLRINKPWK